ncbi:hypothetical protein, partial [Acinetobacter baumannii]
WNLHKIIYRLRKFGTVTIKLADQSIPACKAIKTKS